MKNEANNKISVTTAIIAIIITGIAVFVLTNLYTNNGDKESKNSTSSVSNTSTTTTPTPTPVKEVPKVKGTCKDVTSYDYNWDNDMLCTRPDGTTFYTNYSGAKDYVNSQ